MCILDKQARELAKRLKRQYAPASTLIAGDVVILGPEEFWVLASVHKNEENGFYTFFNDNGDFVTHPPSQPRIIINRVCFGR